MGINLTDWATFSEAERKRIEETLGIRLADYITADEREAVLMEFEIASRRQAEIRARKEVIDYYFDRQEKSAAQQAELEARVLSVRPAQRYLPELPAQVEVLPIQPSQRDSPEVLPPVIRYKPEVISPRTSLQLRDRRRTVAVREERNKSEPQPAPYSFLSSIKRYALVTAFTLGGAYFGFSAARHTDLADELRRMEETSLIKAYQVVHLVGEKSDSAKKGIQKAARVIDTLTTFVKDVPFLGRGAALIEEQQHQIRLYQQKQEQYTSTLIKYTTAGTGGGFGMGIFLSFTVGRRRKA